MVDSEWLIAGYFVIINIVGACMEWSFKDLVCHFFVLKQRSNLRPSRGSQARKKITNDADISLQGVRDPKRIQAKLFPAWLRHASWAPRFRLPTPRY